MGTCMALSYANLLMGYLQQKFLGSQLDKPSLWLRFINDIFLLWPHGPDSLTAFLEQLNSLYPVHFTWKTPMSLSWMYCRCPYRPRSFLHLCPHQTHKLPIIPPLPHLSPHINQTLQTFLPCHSRASRL